MVTLKEIAQECNVSATTVSNILNGKPKVSEETRLKVLDVVKRRGYQPNYIAPVSYTHLVIAGHEHPDLILPPDSGKLGQFMDIPFIKSSAQFPDTGGEGVVDALH